MPPAPRPHSHDAPRPRARRLRVAALLLAPVILLLLGVATALGAPGSIQVIDRSPTLGDEVTVAAPGGGSFRADPGRALVRITPAGGTSFETPAWCVDTRRGIAEGREYAIDLQSAADTPELAGPAAQEAAWLIGRADGLIAAAASPGLEAAAIQVAVWQLTGQAADVAAVTDDTVLNARVVELRALAAGRTPVTTIALSGPAGAVAPGAPATVSVTGTPGATVALEVSAGAASLSAAIVTLGPSGSAQVAVTPSAAGQVTLTARAEGGLLWRATHLPERASPQDMAYVTPVAVTASTTLSAVAPIPGPGVSGAPAPTPAPPAARPAALRLVKSAPATVRRGLSIPYTLTVTNVSRRTARAVVVRDPLPQGTFLVRIPARARLSGGVIVWRLGDLAPGERVVLRARLRTLPAATPLIRNVARASAANAATVRARAVTRLRPARRPTVAPVVVAPAVTG